MSDNLIQELKARLKIEDLVATYGTHAQGEVKGRGRELCGARNDSLKVYPVDQAWRWYSQQIDRKQDVLAWIMYGKFGRLSVEGEDFVEVLKIGCGLCGLDFEQYAKGPKSKTYGQRRKLEDILERYVSIGEDLRNPEFYVRVRQIGKKVVEEKDGEKIDVPGKTWITQDICERWRLIPAPTLAQCERAGVSVDELRCVELARIGRDEEPYMFFRDSLIIPTLYRGRVQYLSSRTFTDFLPDGTKREKTKLHMPALPLLPRPPAFNLDVLNDPEAREKGVIGVEAPLDAIRTCETGHPALALYGSVPGEDLVKMLRRAG